ncbi:Undecaprenyl-diphosphatase [Chitinispirillum alkaliphilum]|nr:Undecaprenyl-diphosphatase [Chitinispirillum alkaliphilum]
MEIIKTIILGIIQGITEFIPVSSSGHLALGQYFFNMGENSLVMEAVLHLATGIAVVIVFWKDIIWLITDSFSPDIQKRNEALKYNGWIILGSIPAAIVGLQFKDFFVDLFRTPQITSVMLIVTSLFLFFSYKRDNPDGKLTALKVIAIGIIQAFAIMPGISRSGSTIAIALLVGVSRKESGRFSFLLSLPAVFGVAILEARHISTTSFSISALIMGFIVSLIVGILSLKLLLNFIKNGKLYFFGYYCAAVGVISLIVITFFRNGSV